MNITTKVDHDQARNKQEQAETSKDGLRTKQSPASNQSPIYDPKPRSSSSGNKNKSSSSGKKEHKKPPIQKLPSIDAVLYPAASGGQTGSAASSSTGGNIKPTLQPRGPAAQEEQQRHLQDHDDDYLLQNRQNKADDRCQDNRYSVVFFFYPQYDAQIPALPAGSGPRQMYSVFSDQSDAGFQYQKLVSTIGDFSKIQSLSFGKWIKMKWDSVRRKN
ncbi:unnamed protein product [Amoebophrya sp. A25]|nr:unnamed protein product [Amoebophrya sp. A25]|eukprot:GSA25T00009376001.1